MKLTPPTAPLPPFWAAVRRRHPDVDIVVLPDERPAAGEAVDDAVVLAAVDRVTATVRDLTGDIDAPGAEAAPAYGPTEGTVVARSRTSTRRDDGHEALAALRTRLAADGWDVRRLEGGVARLVAHRDGLRLRASYAEPSGAFLLEVASVPLPVGTERARGLVRR